MKNPRSKVNVPINVDTLFRHLGLSFADIKNIDRIVIKQGAPTRITFFHKIGKDRSTTMVISRRKWDTVIRMLVLKNLLRRNVFEQNTKKKFDVVGFVYDTGVRVIARVELY